MKLILASNSPRRKELLTKMGYKYDVKPSDNIENWEYNISPKSTAMSLAFQKGIDIAINNPNDTIISADTIVVLNNKIIGKPVNKKDAFEILSILNNKKHSVITAFSILSINRNIKIVDFEISYVRFKKLLADEIEKYLLIEEAYDKAGAYAIQGEGRAFVQDYEGSYNNIIGFPTEKIDKMLKKFLY